MKVVIELIGNESRESLLATSNYLRELAEGSLPVSTEAKVYGPNELRNSSLLPTTELASLPKKKYDLIYGL